VFDIVNEPSDTYQFPTACKSGNHTGKRMYPWHEMIGIMDETDQRVASLFTKKSHHRNISVMYIVQNLFHRGKHHTAISLNVVVNDQMFFSWI
jgi:hypothetical protein